MAVSNVMLSPVQEMAAGQVAAIRNQVIKAVVEKASRELSLPKNKLVVRDIRCLSDLGFGKTPYMATAVTDNIWGTYEGAGPAYIQAGSAGAYRTAITSDTTMADQRYIAIYGVRDLRLSRPIDSTLVDSTVTLIKFNIGNADRAIWDLHKCESYTNFVAGITSSAIVIPPLAAYQISPYVSVDTVEPGLQLMGVVVEPAGLLVTPLTRADGIDEAIETQLIPVMELAPGQIGRIRNLVRDAIVAMASTELNLPPEKLVVRDIRPFTDLGWCTHATGGYGGSKLWNSTVTSTDTWEQVLDGTYAFPSSATTFYDIIASGNTTMASGRFVAIYGIRDYRTCLETVIESAVTMMKFTVGGNDRAIWDLQSKDAYRNALVAVSPSAIIIPQNTDYQIGFHCGYSTDNTGSNLAIYLSLEGFVVEQIGKVLSP